MFSVLASNRGGHVLRRGRNYAAGNRDDACLLSEIILAKRHTVNNSYY